MTRPLTGVKADKPSNYRSIERIAGRIVAGDQFKPEVLQNQILSSKRIEEMTTCRPTVLRSVAIIRLRAAEAGTELPRR